MAAPIAKCCRSKLLTGYQQIYTPIRHKYWVRSDDSIYEKGDSYGDRIVGVEQKKKLHPETQIKGQYELNPVKGKVYYKQPFPVDLKAGKRYKWCVCGYSKSQPFCDGHHRMISNFLWSDRAKPGSPFENVKHHPVIFEVEKDGQYWLCNCKQTDNRPFCDGTHLQPHIQSKFKR